MLAFDSSMSEEGKQMLQRITDRAEKMNVMIKTVLDYSRIGRLPEETRLIDTAAVIKEIIEDMEHTYQVFNVHISTGKIPSLRGDPVMIWQVFSNLIGNAVKYSQYAAAPAVHIEGWTSGKKILYSIRDNGIGIAQKDLDNIFLLFSRMSNTGNIEGTGVGLAIVKKIVEKHAGIIWAESELGVGTTFFLSFTVA